VSLKTNFKIVFPTGLALFAMFFGAGNILFPLDIGSTSGQHTLLGGLGFLISGVGMPFLGLFAGVLYQGDYWRFFERIGKIPAFILVTLLMILIGPLIAIPRITSFVHSTLQPLLPEALSNAYLFDLIYFAAIYLVISNKSRVVDIIGWVLAPIKVITFTLLIVVGLFFYETIIPTDKTAIDVFNQAFVRGYATMDLLAALFFCSVAYKNIQNKCLLENITSEKAIRKMTLYSCIIGAVLISLAYLGFVYVAAVHAQELQGIPSVEILAAISSLVLGKYGLLFVGICVTFACLTTAAALTEITIEYIHEVLLKERVSRGLCIAVLFITMYIIALTGFDNIMRLALPILTIIYPVLIVLCIVNIYMVLARANTKALL
jgi:LIVCS family branched-chain amino acid:cation transporter